MTIQQCSIAAQTAIGLTVIAILRRNDLRQRLSDHSDKCINCRAIVNSGATDIQGLVSETELLVVLGAYNSGLDKTFYCALAASSLAFVASLFSEWKLVK